MNRFWSWPGLAISFEIESMEDVGVSHGNADEHSDAVNFEFGIRFGVN